MNPVKIRTYPIYVKATFLLLFAILAFKCLIWAEFILIPFTLGSLLAILFTPIATKFEKWGAHRAISSFACIALMMLFVAGLVFLLAHQVMSFINSVPEVTSHISHRLNDIQRYIEKETKMDPDAQIDWLKSKLAIGGVLFAGALSATTTTFATLSLVPLYTFFMLFYRDKIFTFFEKVTPDHQHETIYEIIRRIQELVQSYLTGILIVVFIISVIISTGLGIIGVPYAIFLGVIAGFLNVIPYLGILTAAAISVIISMVMMDSANTPIIVFFLFLGTHMLEANIITPNIVGSKVSINTLASLLALIVGAEVWGIVGMIVFIPLLGVIKVIFDNFPVLEPYGFLLGKEQNAKHAITWKGTWRRIFKRSGKW